MTRSKVQKFKDAFKSKSTLNTLREEKLKELRAGLKEVTELKRQLHREHHAVELIDREVQAITLEVNQAESNPDPGEGIATLKDLAPRVTNIKDSAREAVTEYANSITQVNRKIKAIREQIDNARKSRRNVVDDEAAIELGHRIDLAVEDLNEHVTKAVKDPYNTLDVLDGVLKRALGLAVDAERAMDLPPTPGGKRAASREVVESLTGIPQLEEKLGGDERDRRGRTGKEQVAAVLDIFDDHFALDEHDNPKAKTQNGAMRMTAVVNTLARKLATEQNDLRLTPLLSKSVLKEYGDDLQRNLQGEEPVDELKKQEVEKIMKLASALVIDDPVGKMLSGNMTGPDAVQKVRDMAAAGGVEPSQMLAMLKQQFEMNLASLSVDEVVKGTLRNDTGEDEKGQQKTHTFEIKDLYGEMSKDRYFGGDKVWKQASEGMVETDQVLHEGEAPTLPSKLQGDRPKWTDEGDGLKFKPKALDMLETLAREVSAWDGVSPDVPTPRPSKEQIESWREFAEEQPRPESSPITPEGLKEAAQKLKSPNESAAERLKKRTDGLNAAAVALTVLDPSSALNTAAESLITKSDRDFFIEQSQGFSDPPSPEQLAELAKALKARALDVKLEDTEPFIMPTGLRQDHKVRDVLSDKDSESRADKYADVDWENISPEEYKKLRAEQTQAAEAMLRNGVMTSKQYEHLRTLRSLDRDDRDEFQDPAGKDRNLEQFVLESIAERYGTDVNDAKRLVAGALDFLKKVPLTLTFNGERLFSDPSKDEPKYGPVYSTEVVIARDQRSVEDMIGRGDNISVKNDRGEKEEPLAGVTGGKDTGWVDDRGENYLRWRSEKDEREGRLDQIPVEDQQIFAAANPNFNELKGGRGTSSYGENYYGKFHFLLKDDVRVRCAFVVRGMGAVSPVQRTDMLLLLADMIRGGQQQKEYLDSVLVKAGKKGMVRGTGLDWEVHLYGGFDLRTDVSAIYIQNDTKDELKGRIERFAKKFGILCEPVGKIPEGIEVISSNDPKALELAK